MSLPSPHRLTLRSRIALSTAVVFIGFVSSMAVLGLRYFETEFRNNLYTQQFALISTVATNLDDKLRMSQKALIAVGKGIPKAMLADVEGTQKFLDQQYSLLTVFDHGIVVLKPDGRTITESPLRRSEEHTSELQSPR